MGPIANCAATWPAATRRGLAGCWRNCRMPPTKSCYEFNAVGYAIHSWQVGTLRILLEHGITLSKEDQQHILRITKNDQEFLDELMAIRGG